MHNQLDEASSGRVAYPQFLLHTCSKTVLFDMVYALRAPDGHLIEVRRRDLADNAPKSQVFQWLWIDSERVCTLQFRAMQTDNIRQRRTFQEGELWFDRARGELKWKLGPSVPLTTLASDDLPRPVLQRIGLHLS